MPSSSPSTHRARLRQLLGSWTPVMQPRCGRLWGWLSPQPEDVHACVKQQASGHNQHLCPLASSHVGSLVDMVWPFCSQASTWQEFGRGMIYEQQLT
jgi:hypothetical protein